MSGLYIKAVCPKCGYRIGARINSTKKFILYSCPGCDRNVVIYENKIDVISQKLVKEMIKKGYLESCGIIGLSAQKKIREKKGRLKNITKEDIIDLKILLETRDDVDSVIRNL